MAKPTTKTFANFIVEIEDAANPTTYLAPCGFTSKALNLSAATSETNVPDCDDPEAPAWTERGISALSGQITGGGVMATESSDLWEEWFDSGLPKNIRVRVPGVGYRAGSALLTSLGASVALNSDGNKVQRSVTLDSNGEWPWVAGDPA